MRWVCERHNYHNYWSIPLDNTASGKHDVYMVNLTTTTLHRRLAELRAQVDTATPELRPHARAAYRELARDLGVDPETPQQQADALTGAVFATDAGLRLANAIWQAVYGGDGPMPPKRTV